MKITYSHFLLLIVQIIHVVIVVFIITHLLCLLIIALNIVVEVIVIIVIRVCFHVADGMLMIAVAVMMVVGQVVMMSDMVALNLLQNDDEHKQSTANRINHSVLKNVSRSMKNASDQTQLTHETKIDSDNYNNNRCH